MKERRNFVKNGVMSTITALQEPPPLLVVGDDQQLFELWTGERLLEDGLYDATREAKRGDRRPLQACRVNEVEKRYAPGPAVPAGKIKE